MNLIFGPVPSRRLGRSLGIDLVPFKTCSYDCVYCQLGRTTCKTAERREWVSMDPIFEELQSKLDLKPDWITLSGSGEPTLYSHLDRVIERIHSMTHVPVAVLTNGSLLWQPEVRAQLSRADLVIPSLDAGSPAIFEAMNRPVPQLDFQSMLEGLIAFRHEFKNPIWLEVFFLEGINTDAQSISDIVESVRKIGPDRIQLNTATRPTAEDHAIKVTPERLSEIAAHFHSPAEIIADYRSVHAQTDFTVQKDNIFELLQRRPCSLNDIAEGMGIHRNEAIKYIEELQSNNLLNLKEIGDKKIYSAKQKENS